MQKAHAERRPLPRSLYADTAVPAPDTPVLSKDGTAQVVIVGGGYTGLSTALHLAESGADAIVLEAHEPGWGASGRNGGQVNPGLYPDPERIAEQFGRERAMAMLRFASGAPDRVFDLVRRHGIDCEAEQTGTLRVAFNAAGEAKIAATLGQYRSFGLPAECVDSADLQRRTGTSRYRSGIFLSQGGKLNPLGYARGLAKTAIAAGARVHGGTPALRLQRTDAGWTVETPRAKLRADNVVLATNGYTDGLWPGLRQSVVPVYTTIVASEPLPAEIAGRVMPAGSVLYEVGNNTVYYRLDRQNRLLMGGRSVQRDVTGMADARSLQAYALKLWPFLSGIGWTHVWNGQVAITTDHQIHLHELTPGLTACLGYNGRGIAMATSMGGVIARRLLGASAEELPMPITALQPIRFHALWKPVTAVRLAYGAVLDRFSN